MEKADQQKTKFNSQQISLKHVGMFNMEKQATEDLSSTDIR